MYGLNSATPMTLSVHEELNAFRSFINLFAASDCSKSVRAYLHSMLFDDSEKIIELGLDFLRSVMGLSAEHFTESTDVKEGPTFAPTRPGAYQRVFYFVESCEKDLFELFHRRIMEFRHVNESGELDHAIFCNFCSLIGLELNRNVNGFEINLSNLYSFSECDVEVSNKLSEWRSLFDNFDSSAPLPTDNDLVAIQRCNQVNRNILRTENHVKAIKWQLLESNK